MSRREILGTTGGGALLVMASACSRQDQAAETDLARLDAVETAARIRAGDVSAAEVVDAAIERAERINPKINAMVVDTFDAARDQAANAGDGPWAGVPTFIKDLDDIPGIPTGLGSRAFAGNIGQEPSPVIDAILGLGVVSLGKSATPEFGLTATTEPLSNGASRNPWNIDHSTGGSSGGAAALVASGIVPIAHGSDGGGSLRIPASCCGLVALKTSRGRNPAGRPEGPISIAVHGAETRTVRDTAAFAASIEAPAATSGLPEIGLVTSPSKKRLRIGVIEKTAHGGTQKEILEANEATAKRCAELGHHIEQTDLPFDESLIDDFVLYWASYAAMTVKLWEEMSGGTKSDQLFEPFTLGLVDHFEANIGGYMEAVGRLQAAVQTFENMFDKFDVILSPVLAAPPPEIGHLRTDLEYGEVLERLLDYAQFTSYYNVSGAPAISLPLSMSSNNLPIGSMFGAKSGDERTLLELAFELEQAHPWAERRPPIYG